MKRKIFSCVLSVIFCWSLSPVFAADAPGSPFAVKGEAEFFALLDLELPELAEIKAAVEKSDYSAAKQAWGKHLQQRTTPRWTWSHRDRERLLEILNQKFGGLQPEIRKADLAVQRDFTILGVRKQLEHHIEWLHGPIEWTHVLSRFEYWRDMGLAYWATGKSIYPTDFVYVLKCWIAENPIPAVPTGARGKHGSVWRPLETGIRADTWFEVMELFMDAPEFDAEAKYLMSRSLFEHARYLWTYNRNYRPGNHQVCEANGLATIGIMFPECKESEQWRERGFHYLARHMQEGVKNDGAYREFTPGYHSWVMMEFAKISILAKINGYEVPGLLDKHEKMFEYLMHVRQSEGTFALLGDAGYEKEAGTASAFAHEVAPFLSVGAMLYDRKDMRFLGMKEPTKEMLWLFGPNVFDQYAAMEKREPAFTSSVLPDAKCVMMRTGWDPNARFFLFDCSPWGGGHSHADRLQIIASAERELLVDPGIFSYDEPLCGYLKSSEAHNILMIDGKEQSKRDPELLCWETNDRTDFAAGQLEGNGFRQQRSVLFVKPDYVIVVDHVFGEESDKEEHELTRLFHFPPQSDVTFSGNASQTGFSSGTNIRVESLDSKQSGVKLEMREGLIPETDSTATKAPVAALVSKNKLPAAFAVALIPFEKTEGNNNRLPKITRLPSDDPLTVRLQIQFPGGRVDAIEITPDPANKRITLQ